MSSKIHLITFASDAFRRMGQALGIVSIHRGFDSFYLYDPNDYQEDFKIRNLETLSLSRGGGYWLWKPHIILMATQRYAEGELIFYLDSGALPRRPSAEYKLLITDTRIHVWAEEASRIQTWTDPNVILAFGKKSEHAASPMIWAGAIVAKNSQLLERFAQYWLKVCEEPRMLRPETANEYVKKPGFIWHRHDQSILSLIVAEYPEWFVVHSSKNNNPWIQYFDRHRNFKIKYFLKIRSYPRIRVLRKSAIDKLPQGIRSAIRERRTLNQNRKLSGEEIRSLKQSY